MHGRIVHGGLLEPVGTVPGSVHDTFVLFWDQCGPVVGGNTCNLVGLIIDLHILFGIQRCNTIGIRVLPSHIAVEAYLYATASLTFLGGYQNNTIGTTCTIDGAGGGILQNVDTLDIVGREVLDSGIGNTVYNYQRVGITVSSDTADGNLIAFAWLSGILYDVHTWGLTLQGAIDIHSIRGCDILGIDMERGTSHQFLALCTVTHYHDIIQKF